MSLDFYLYSEEPALLKERSGIFVRRDGRKEEISREEWDRINPHFEPVILRRTATATNEVFWANITHNLCSMANEAGIYEYLWRPGENGITTAVEMIILLETGLERLRANPDRFQQFNPENGWGTYEGLVRVVEDVLAACRAHPNATVRVSR